MAKFHHIITLSSYVALTCGSSLMNTGCGTTNENKADSAEVSLEVRFQDDTAPTPQSSAGTLRFASLVAAPTAQAAGPTTHDQVARILVDITAADNGQPFFLNFELTQIATDVWRGDVPFLPRDQQFRFAARALDANSNVAFSGDTVATLTVDNQSLQIPLAPAQNGQTFQMPRMLRIAYPGQIYAGAEEQVAFTILGNAGAAIGLQITPLGSPMTPAPEFSPASGTVTLTNTVADFMAVYTAPEVTTDTDFDYQVTITDTRAQTAVAITTNFRTHIIPRPPGAPIVHNIQPSVLFNPVILSLTANGSETPGTVELVADVSDDSAPDRLTFQWSYTPNPGTPGATFANNGQGNPGLFEGYTVDHEGTITLAVTDEHDGTTILHYQLGPNQFADAINHIILKRIVSGDAHTCVLTGQNQVRCWGDNQFGQLGHGTTIDLGDAPSRLPWVAGDVPLPASDPVQQLVAGNNHTCVLLASGLVYCWGDNRLGQLGYGRTDNLADDEPLTSFGYVTLGDLATRIAAGGDHTCAILASGALRCWGRNDFGQLGHGNTANIGDNEFVYSAGDVDLGPGATVKDLALGDFHTCALLTTGAVHCWGRNDAGQLGYGNTANLGDNEPINNLPDVSLTGTVRKLVAGSLHTCALSFAGTLRCWGDGRFGQLGQSFGGGDAFWGNAANELPSNLPGDISTGAQVIDVAAGDSHTCALSSDGQLKCWGRGDSGQLGYGDFNNLGAPPAAGVDLDGVVASRISAGAAHTCALRSDGTARCWGQGADGRLGRGSTATSATATGNVDIQIFVSQYTVGGTVSGLAGAGLVLRANGGDDLAISSDGSFTFATPIVSGATFAVTVRSQPSQPSQTCTVSGGTGTIGSANIDNVTVTCTTDVFTIGGTVSGLAAGDALTLRDNGGDTLVRSASGSFTFATPVTSGQPYAVTVASPTSPISQTCIVTSGTGTVGSGNVTNVTVTCTTNTFMVGGTVTGLTGTGLVLRNNGGDDLSIFGNGGFTFATPVASGATYNVAVKTQPPGQTCTVASGTGTLSATNITNVRVTCILTWSPSLFPIAVPGTNYGLGDLTLDNNGDLLVVVASPARSIVRVNHVTGAQTTVASGIGPSSNFLLGVAYRAANNMIYMSTSDGASNSQIFSVTPTGTVTPLTTISAAVNAITIAPSNFGSFGGFIIGVTEQGAVIAVNPANRVVTTITAAAGPASDLVFAPNGTLYICGATTVRTITAAGVVTPFATGFGSADGITITPDGARMFIADSGTNTVRQVTIPGAVVTTFAPADIDSGFGVGGLLAAPGNTLIVMTGETSLTLEAFTY